MKVVKNSFNPTKGILNSRIVLKDLSHRLGKHDTQESSILGTSGHYIKVIIITGHLEKAGLLSPDYTYIEFGNHI